MVRRTGRLELRQPLATAALQSIWQQAAGRLPACSLLHTARCVRAAVAGRHIQRRADWPGGGADQRRAAGALQPGGGAGAAPGVHALPQPARWAGGAGGGGSGGAGVWRRCIHHVYQACMRAPLAAHHTPPCTTALLQWAWCGTRAGGGRWRQWEKTPCCRPAWYRPSCGASRARPAAAMSKWGPRARWGPGLPRLRACTVAAARRLCGCRRCPGAAAAPPLPCRRVCPRRRRGAQRAVRLPPPAPL